jgi:hypothetical protein
MERRATMTWLGVSIVLSLLLTIILNVALRMFPDFGRRLARGLTQPSFPSADQGRPSKPQLRLWTPWKAMILGSVILTIVLNLLIWIARP